ncbi:terminal uridylyltransferase 7-like [Bacillus rossius redtenbacheri]|uniref:terminal uridylyltransferase 7-like n=1 Tax=Bacillus rossius redtenbacheri TaxID=93214 RepID=UPI002FDCBD4E
MLPSPRGAAQRDGGSEEPGGARQAQVQAQGVGRQNPPPAASAKGKGLPSPENKKLRIKKEKKPPKEKKKKKARASDADHGDKGSLDIQAAIAALAAEMERMQTQNVQVDANNRIVPPVLTPEQETLLGKNFVNVLEYKSPKHPTALFQCVLCKKFCKSYDNVSGHVSESLHKQKLQRLMDDMTLNCLPPPTKDQIEHVTRVVHDVLSSNGLGDKGIEDRAAVTERLDTLAKQVHPDCGVRMYGSTVYGLALKTSDLNLELTVGDESKASKMLCLLADEIEKDDGTYRNLERNFTDSEPALKFYVREYKFRCVVIMQNKHSYQLSKLIAQYVDIDQRVRPLGIMFRTLAADLGLDKPDMGFWPPHAFALLLIYFLQQLDDPVLPVLHELVHDLEYNPEVYCDEENMKQKWHTTNTTPVGELWLKLLRFYTVEFPTHEYVVCIRQKAPLTRTSKNWTGKKIAIEDPFRPKLNVSRSLEIFVCFEFAMNCLRNAYKYFGVLQLGTGPILSWIYDSSRLKCTFQPPVATRKKLEGYAISAPFCDDNPPQNVKFASPEMPVTKEDAIFLFQILNPTYLCYRYDPAKFLGKEGVPVRCATCGNMGHSANRCKVEKLLPIPENLPPMEDYYLDAIMQCCCEIEKRWSMQPDEVEKRKQIVSDVEMFVCVKKPDARLQLFGSSCNGFGLQKSDIDICMTFRSNEKGEGIEFVKAIEELTHLLRGYNKMKNILAITTAKVPIMKFYLPESDLEGDISMYNVLALRNTQLLNMYSAIDPRVKTLGCVVKRFAKACDICDASRGSLSSYAYILMLIFFLQRCEPPVLPVLQELCTPQESQFMIDEFDTYFYNDLGQLPSVWDQYGQNKASVSDLWLEFLKFYSKFNFNLHVISIRQLKPLLCFEKRWTNRVMAIEDPFELTHNLGARLSRKMLVFIINTFRTAYKLFSTPRISCLDYIGRLERYFLDPRQLTSGEPPNDRGCRLCKKTDHMIKQCPLRKQSRHRNMQQKWGNGQGMDRRQAPRNDSALPRNLVPQLGKPLLLHPGFTPHQPAMPFQGSYKQMLFMNTDLTRNAQNLRYNKMPPAFAARSNNSLQQASPKQVPPLFIPKNVNQVSAGSSMRRGDCGFGDNRDSPVLPHRAQDSTNLRQHTVKNTVHPFRFQASNAVSMPGPSNVSQNSVFSFSAENKMPGPTPRLLNGTVSPLNRAVFEGPPPRPAAFCFYGPPQTPPVVDVTVQYNQKK